ncbi:MAG: hypothetical protein KDA42_16760, partial [Planctomycetales bacterium]|nr:hypothetical protein [Planctomycetales bacterium]
MFRPLGDAALRIWRRSLAGNYDVNNTILVASSGRGGSTWLGELVGTIAGYVILTEPLHLRHNPEIASLGFEWETYVPPDASDPDKFEYLSDVVNGRNISSRIVSSKHVHWSDFRNFRGFVVKFTRANMLLGWFLRQMPLRTLFMIRHPCAVVLSQLRHRAWDGMTKESWPL